MVTDVLLVVLFVFTLAAIIIAIVGFTTKRTGPTGPLGMTGAQGPQGETGPPSQQMSIAFGTVQMNTLDTVIPVAVANVWQNLTSSYLFVTQPRNISLLSTNGTITVTNPVSIVAQVVVSVAATHTTTPTVEFGLSINGQTPAVFNFIELESTGSGKEQTLPFVKEFQPGDTITPQIRCPTTAGVFTLNTIITTFMGTCTPL